MNTFKNIAKVEDKFRYPVQLKVSHYTKSENFDKRAI